MFDLRTVFGIVGAISLIKEPPITAIWQRYHIGVNITQVIDCPASNVTCFIERVRNGNANVENALIVAKHRHYVSVYSILVNVNQCLIKIIAFSLYLLSKA